MDRRYGPSCFYYFYYEAYWLVSHYSLVVLPPSEGVVAPTFSFFAFLPASG